MAQGSWVCNPPLNSRTGTRAVWVLDYGDFYFFFILFWKFQIFSKWTSTACIIRGKQVTVYGSYIRTGWSSTRRDLDQRQRGWMLFLVSSCCTWNIQWHLVELLEMGAPPFWAGVHTGPKRRSAESVGPGLWIAHPGIPNGVFIPSPRTVKSAPYLIDARNRVKIVEI